MSIFSKMKKPEGKDHLEDLCQQLYLRVYDAITCVKVGRSGQAQAGIDILASSPRKGNIGIQCKAYDRTKFSIETVKSDIEKADKANLSISHLLFATTADSNSPVTLAVHEISRDRQNSNKFTVSVDFWDDITSHLRMHPEVASAFIEDYAGSVSVKTLSNTERILDLAAQMSANVNEGFVRIESQNFSVSSGSQLERATPSASGGEMDNVVARQLDMVRDRIRAGKTRDAEEILDSLGDFDEFKDDFSKFRYLTNRASIDMEDGKAEIGAAGLLKAANFAPLNETALTNKAHAYLLQSRNEAALATAEEGIDLFPVSGGLWAIRLHASHRAECPIDPATIPPELHSNDEFIYSHALLLGRSGRHTEALELLSKLLKMNPASLENQRAYLVEALSDATTNILHVALSIVSPEKIRVLEKAVSILEPLEEKLQIQSDAVSLELAVNLSNALRVLQKIDRATVLLETALRRHPNDEELIKSYLWIVETTKGPSEVRSWASGRESALPTAIIMIMLDTASSLGDAAWFSQLESELRERGLPSNQQVELRASKARMIAEVEGEEKAIAFIESEPLTGVSGVVLGSLLSQLLRKVGDDKGSEQALAECFLIAKKDVLPDFYMWQIAVTAQSFRLYQLAIEIYEELLGEPGDNELTCRLLHSYIQSKQSGKAWQLVDRIPSDARDSERLLRIQCELTQNASDWLRLKDATRKLVAKCPDEIEVYLAHAVALHHLNIPGELRKFLTDLPVFTNSEPEYEFELAKYEKSVALNDESRRRLLILFAKNPHSTSIAGYYLASFLGGIEPSASLPPDVVQESTEVVFSWNGDTKKVVIEDLPSGVQGWPEMISPSTILAKSIAGKAVGDKLIIEIGFQQSEAEIISIRPSIFFISEKANEVLSNSPENSGPLWSFQAARPDGSLNFEALLSAVSAKKKANETAFQYYRDRQIPIACLSQFLKIDLVSLAHQWPSEYNLWVSDGNPAELQRSLSLLKECSRPIVIDLFTITEIIRHDIADVLLKSFGRFLVSQSSRDAVENLISSSEIARPSGVLGESEGRLQFHEISMDANKKWVATLHKILSFIDYCEIAPVHGPLKLNIDLESVRAFFERSTFDSINLCAEREAVFLCEDALLRSQVALTGLENSVSLQAVLIHVKNGGAISLERYSKTIIEKLCANHSFVSVRSADLYAHAKMASKSTTNDICIVLKGLGDPMVEPSSAAQVILNFLASAMNNLPHEHVARYVSAALGGFYERQPKLAGEISAAVSYILNSGYGRNGRRLSRADRRHFGDIIFRRNSRLFAQGKKGRLGSRHPTNAKHN